MNDVDRRKYGRKAAIFIRGKALCSQISIRIARAASIKTAFQDNFQCYGYRRIHTEQCKSGKIISEKVVRRNIREEALYARFGKRRRYIGEIRAAVANIVSRDFQ